MDKYLMYLRKSQMDRDFDDVSVEETLKRHKKILTEFCDLHRIFVEQILEEVVSGESLSGRPKMMKALELVNTGEYSGIVCMDIDRLSRGSGMDTGYIMQILQVNNCRIITPSKTYDLSNDSDEQFTDMKFMFSRYELKTITKRLVRGRNQSASEGKFCGSVAPYGYVVVKLPSTKGNTLKIVPVEADVVRMIFRMYCEGTGYNTIAYKLNQMHIQSKTGTWGQTSVSNIINNEVYIGKIRWKRSPTRKGIEDGQIVRKRFTNNDYELHDGLHEPVIDMETWIRAKEIQKSRSNASAPINKELQNPFADLLFCSMCGGRIRRNTPASYQTKVKPWFRCVNAGRTCDCRTLKCDAVEDAVVQNMTEWLKDYTVTIQRNTSQNKTDSETAMQVISEQLEVLQNQQEKACEMLEKGVYSLELFTKRNAVIEKQITDLKEALNGLKVPDKKPDLAPVTQHLLDSYDNLTTKEKNLLWKQVLEKITIYKSPSGDEEIHLYPKL